MMRENEKLPEIERLKDEEFNLDVEEQKRLEAIVEQEVTQVIHILLKHLISKMVMIGMILNAIPL